MFWMVPLLLILPAIISMIVALGFLYDSYDKSEALPPPLPPLSFLKKPNDDSEEFEPIEKWP